MPEQAVPDARVERTEQLVAAHGERLFGLAYRMLGSVSEAEDAVQEGFARLVATDGVEEPAAWLTTVVARTCIDRLRSAQRRRETYVGPWLPEPLLTDDHDPADAVATADSLTFAFLVVLERLSPAERAVLLLHDVFGYPHTEVATMLDRSHAAVRKLASRARARLEEDRPRYEQDVDRRDEVTAAFLAACAGEDLGGLMDVLAPGVVLTSDGGGAVSAARRPVRGADRVARFLMGILPRAAEDDWRVAVLEVNAQPGLVAVRDGEVDTVMTLHVADGRVRTVHAIRNPAKLTAVAARLATIEGGGGIDWLRP